jgi:hypothetical protein
MMESDVCQDGDCSNTAESTGRSVSDFIESGVDEILGAGEEFADGLDDYRSDNILEWESETDESGAIQNTSAGQERPQSDCDGVADDDIDIFYGKCGEDDLEERRKAAFRDEMQGVAEAPFIPME